MANLSTAIALLYTLLVITTATGGLCSSNSSGSCSSGSNFLQFASRRGGSCASFEDWPDVDGVTCGNCKALVQTRQFKRCDDYCASFKHKCVAAAEEKSETCEVEKEYKCDEDIQGTSDMLCTCERDTTIPEVCYGHLEGVATDEGGAVKTVGTTSLSKCQDACDSEDDCKSFALCPLWGCFLKDRALTGNEPSRSNRDCKTYFKTDCGESTSTATTTTTTMTTTTSSALKGEVCYASLDGVARDEGRGLGHLESTYLIECERACDATEGCRSFARCPRWGKCFFKDRSFTGSESTRTDGECATFYQIDCSLTTTTTTTTRVGGGNVVKVVSYNLYWWNAFGQNSWKSDGIIDNIKDTLTPDAIGLQECDSPSSISSRTGVLDRASVFKGAQGVMVKPGLFTTSNSGSRDLDATGKWGPRYVTWVKLTDESSGHVFWHFNTHWCVHSEGDRICNEDVRYRGAQNMLKAIQENAKDAPVVITGDFNAGMGEKGIRHFLDNGFKLAVDSWVDAIFYSKHWDLLTTGVGEMAGSDHRPVWAELSLK